MSIVYSELLDRKASNITEFSLYYDDYGEQIIEGDEKRRGEGSAGFAATTLNLLKSIIGTGLLALPFVFDSLGPLLAIPLLCIFAYFSIVGLRIYSLCGMRTGADSLGSVCRMVDRKLQIFVDLALLIMSFGTLISFFTIVGDSLPTFSHLIHLNLSRSTSIMLSLIPILPICCLKTGKHLKYTSILGLGGVVFILFNALKLLKDRGVSKDLGKLYTWNSDSLKHLNLFIFVFTCHQNLLHIKADAKDKSEAFMQSSINTSIISSEIIYISFSILSWLVFGSSIKPNILNNCTAKISILHFYYIDPDGIMTNVSKLLYVLMIIFSFPLMVPPAQSALNNLLQWRMKKMHSTVIIILSTSITGLFVRDLSKILTLIGVIAGVPICYLLPGYLHYKLFNDDPDSDKHFKTNSVVSMIMCVIGLLLLISFILL